MKRLYGLERWVLICVCVCSGDANYPFETYYVTISVAAAQQRTVAVKEAEGAAALHKSSSTIFTIRSWLEENKGHHYKSLVFG